MASFQKSVLTIAVVFILPVQPLHARPSKGGWEPEAGKDQIPPNAKMAWDKCIQHKLTSQGVHVQ